jgi:superfamily II DNA/RNA helicase
LFVEKKAQIAQVCDYLKDLQPLMIHGSLSQSARIKMLNQLNDCRVIITSDLLARGIDILVDLIILFNATEGENFWHRIGRTGRIGRKGLVITLDDIPTWSEYSFEAAQAALSEVAFKP